MRGGWGLRQNGRICHAVISLAGIAVGVIAGVRPAGLPSASPRPAPPAPPPVTTTEFAVPVLMYHRIDELPPDAGALLRDLTVSPASFEQQVHYLVENGYTLLTAGQVHRAVREREPLPVKAVALTLDGGYEDNFTQAFPILRRYGLDGTLFLVTGTVSTPGHVSWEAARAMQSERMEFGSHSVHHVDLTTLSTEALDEELRESRAELERRLAAPVDQIAYPSGRYNERVKRQAARAGYLAGWKKGGGWVTPDSDPLLHPRVRVRGGTDMARFIRKVTHRPASEEELARYGAPVRTARHPVYRKPFSRI
jgi:peptidoglycan/xylan/chitin deacetylase (PgdA/CDA1 family)